MLLKLEQAEAEWLTEKILTSFGRQVYSKQMSTLNGGITFSEYLAYLDEYHLKNLFKEQVSATSVFDLIWFEFNFNSIQFDSSQFNAS